MNTRTLLGLGLVLTHCPTLSAADHKHILMTHPAHFISVTIARPPTEVYNFVSDPGNLPQWAGGLSGSIKRINGEWIAESPMGRVKVAFVEKNALGVLDHRVTLESGVTVYNPMRVQPNGEGSEVVFTLYRRPEMSDQEFREDSGRVRQDLDRLKAILEKKRASS